MTDLDEAIEKYATIIENKIRDVEQAKKKLDKLMELQKLKMKRLNGEKLSDDEIHKVMGVTCFGNIAHCCKYTRECPWFFSVCDVLGLDPEEVSQFKEKAIRKFLEEKLL